MGSIPSPAVERYIWVLFQRLPIQKTRANLESDLGGRNRTKSIMLQLQRLNFSPKFNRLQKPGESLCDPKCHYWSSSLVNFLNINHLQVALKQLHRHWRKDTAPSQIQVRATSTHQSNAPPKDHFIYQIKTKLHSIMRV